MGKVHLAAVAVMLAATPAALHAADNGALRAADHNGAFELARSDYRAAERVLTASLRVSPRDTDLLLNQAQLYLRTGRPDAARAIYQQVLAQPDEAMLLTGERWQSAHALARAGLRTGGVTTVAAVGR